MTSQRADFQEAKMDFWTDRLQTHITVEKNFGSEFCIIYIYKEKMCNLFVMKSSLKTGSSLFIWLIHHRKKFFRMSPVCQIEKKQKIHPAAGGGERSCSSTLYNPLSLNLLYLPRYSVLSASLPPWQDVRAIRENPPHLWQQLG